MNIQSEADIQAALARVEVYLGEERPRDAVADLQAILAVTPNHPMALCGVGRVSIQLGDNAAALQALDLALTAAPDLAEARNARGAALQNLGRLDEAEAEFRRVAEALPDHPGALVNLAAVLAAKGDVGGAEALFLRVLERRPGDVTAEYNLGLLRLLMGDLAAGWRGFDFRDRAISAGKTAVRSDRPRWRGEAAPDATLLIHAEQGLGDNIQFTRFVSQAAEHVGRVVLEAPEPLVRLFDGLPGADQVIARGTHPPDHDLHVSIMSLPSALGLTDFDHLWTGPYVSAAPKAVARWRGRAEQRAPGPLHVGLLWAGNPGHKRDAERSIPLRTLEPLLTVPGVSFHALQIGPARDQLAATRFSGQSKPMFSQIYPFTEVAAAVAAMDLVIGVDTAVTHLAGAMARPVWNLITHVPDWRWMLARADTPWYPDMRLFRQPAAGDWAAVTGEVQAALREFAVRAGKGG